MTNSHSKTIIQNNDENITECLRLAGHLPRPRPLPRPVPRGAAAVPLQRGLGALPGGRDRGVPRPGAQLGARHRGARLGARLIRQERAEPEEVRDGGAVVQPVHGQLGQAQQDHLHRGRGGPLQRQDDREQKLSKVSKYFLERLKYFIVKYKYFYRIIYF